MPQKGHENQFDVTAIYRNFTLIRFYLLRGVQMPKYLNKSKVFLLIHLLIIGGLVACGSDPETNISPTGTTTISPATLPTDSGITSPLPTSTMEPEQETVTETAVVELPTATAISAESTAIPESKGWQAIHIPNGAFLELQSTLSRPETLYAYGTSHVLKSVDGGRSWSALSNLLGQAHIVIDPNNDDHLYAGLITIVPAQPAGIRESFDGGKTWSELNISPPIEVNERTTYSVQAMAMSTGSANIFVLIRESGGGTFHWGSSQDNGKSWAWQNLPFDEVWQLLVHPDEPNTIFLTTNSGLHVTTDGGTTWSQIFAGDVSQILIDPRDSQVLYAADGQRLQKSENRGQSWQVVGSNAFAIKAMTIDPNNSNVIYALAGNNVIQITDNGATWTNLRSTKEDGLAPNEPADIYAALDGALFAGRSVSRDGGVTWHPVVAGIPTSLELDFIYQAIDDPQIYAVTASSSSTLLTLNGGQSWSLIKDNGAVAFEPSDPQIVYTCLTDAPFGWAKSTDGGINWQPLNEGRPCSGSYMAVLPAYPDRLFVVGSQIEMVNATSGETIASQQLGQINDYYIGILPDLLYVATDNGLYHSENGGETWDATGYTQGRVTAVSVSPNDPNLVLAAIDGGLILSQDAAQTWQTLTSPAQGNLVDVAFDLDTGNIVYIVDAFLGVYYSDTLGSTWSRLEGGDEICQANNSLISLLPVDTEPMILLKSMPRFDMTLSVGLCKWQP